MNRSFQEVKAAWRAARTNSSREADVKKQEPSWGGGQKKKGNFKKLMAKFAKYQMLVILKTYNAD